jgi:ABC-type polysaccharide/polyol phosphate export permease
MYSLPVLTWIRFLAWLDIGLLIYFFYSRTHSRIADKVMREKKLHWKDIAEFFGIFACINGILFGLLSLLAISGITSKSSWQQISFDPKNALIICGILLLAGIILYSSGKLSREKS